MQDAWRFRLTCAMVTLLAELADVHPPDAGFFLIAREDILTLGRRAVVAGKKAELWECHASAPRSVDSRHGLNGSEENRERTSRTRKKSCCFCLRRLHTLPVTSIDG